MTETPGQPEASGNTVETIAAYAPGMMDRSRFPSSLLAPGGPVIFVASAAELAESGATAVMIDLDRCEDVAAFLMDGVTSLGFGSHVENETLTAASDAGVDRVMARSAFFRQIPQLVASLRAGVRETS